MMKDFIVHQDCQNLLEQKMKELLEVCQLYNLPMFATVAIKNDNGITEYKNIVYGSKSHNIDLYDDHIVKHMLIANGGWDVTLKRDTIIFNANDFLQNNDKESGADSICSTKSQ